jgi:hypothetical protein
MDTGTLNTVRAHAFCLSNASIKTRMHFFPSAGITTGPFSIACTLTLFGKGIERKSVVLDGGRLGQPDGLRLEDAFPVLRGDVAGIFGLEIQLACSQSRVNLLSSQAAIELASPQLAVMFGVEPFSIAPPEAGAESDAGPDALTVPKRGPRTAAGLLDDAFVSSLIVVNETPQQIKPEVFKRQKEGMTPLQVGTVAPECAVEIALDETLFKDSSEKECSWGRLRAEGVYVIPDAVVPNPGIPNATAYGVAYYLMYRDAATKRPVSVCAL